MESRVVSHRERGRIKKAHEVMMEAGAFRNEDEYVLQG